MNMVIYTVVGLSLTWLVYIAYMQLVSKAIEGKSSDALEKVIPELIAISSKAIVYCYSPTCGPCRNMTPIIDQLNQEGSPIFKIDISAHSDVAKDIGVQGVPTLLVIDHGKIIEVTLGAQNRQKIESMLGG